MIPKEHRSTELRCYHEHNLNEARWLRYNQKNGAKRLGGILARLFRDRQTELFQAARRVGLHKQTPEEKKLSKALRRRLDKWRGVQKQFSSAFRCKSSSRYILDLCGISLQGLRNHIEGLFKPGMSWENYGFYGWHIDHVRPCASFEIHQKKECFHFTNLQPLWAEENLSKSDKI